MARTCLLQLYLERYEPLALRSRRPNTKRLYRETLRLFERWLQRPARLADLNDETVSRYAAWRLSTGRAKRTVNKDLFNLLAIWRWCHKKGLVKNWPDVELEKPPTRVPVALLRKELALVRKAILSESAPVGDCTGPKFWLALFLLIWDSGERIGAVMGLTWERVDLQAGWVRFVAEDRKGATADSAVPIAADTIAALSELATRHGRHCKVFRWPYAPTYIYYRLAKIMRRAGLPDDRLHKFHCWRKSFASHYEAAGGNVTEWFGHSSRKITRAYLDPRICQRTAAKDILFRPGE